VPRPGLGRAASIAIALTTAGCLSGPQPTGLVARADELRTHHRKADIESATDLYRRAFEAARRSDPRTALEAATGLGKAFEQLGFLDRSLSAYAEAVALVDRVDDRQLQSRAHSTVGVAQALTGASTLDEAMRHCETANTLAGEQGNVARAAAQYCFAEVAYARGRLADALDHYQRAEATWTGANDRSGMAQAALALGWLHSEMGQLDLSMTRLEEARRLWQQVGEPRQGAITRIADARVRQRRGDYQHALAEFEEAARVLEPMGDSIWLGASLTGKAQVLLSTADVIQALPVWEQAFHLFEAAGAKPAAVDALSSAGETLLASGDDLGAADRFERALSIAKELGNVRLQAWAHRSMASVALSRSRADEARQQLQDALELLPSADEPRLQASIRADMARTSLLQGDAAEAWRQIDRALTASRTASDGYGAARQLHERGVVERRLGRLADSRATLREALDAQEELYGPGHPLSAEVRAALAGVEFMSGRLAAVMPAAMLAEESSRDYVRQVLRYLPERQALALAARRPGGLDLAISLVAAGAAPAPSQVLDAVVRRRSLVLDELAARHRAADSDDPRTAELVSSVQSARQRYANLIVRSFEDSVDRALIDQARGESEAAERALAAASASGRPGADFAGLAEVRNALPTGAALVSYVQYARTRRDGGASPGSEPEWSLGAFVVAEGAVRFSPLGAVADIERLVDAWRRETAELPHRGEWSLKALNESYLATGARLRAAIWDPVARSVGRADRIFVVPDGAIALVALDALPLGVDRFLIEYAPPLHYLSAERDLIAATTSGPRGEGVFAIGGATFDQPLSPSTTPSAVADGKAAVPAVPDAAASCGLQGLAFSPLHGTRDEVQELARLWAEPGIGVGAVDVRTGGDASESAFKQQARNHRILHLATHGFFLGAGCTTARASNVRGVGGLSIPAVSADNPFLLSGLALAGANRRALAGPDEDDGILTAEEVASLDLSGVEWAVLSACDTGVGQIQAGEGVFGLRRAFQIAGARTVVMSLWSVDDQATRAWMKALYEGRFQRQLSTADAVHQASLTVLRDRRAKGLSTHPFFWAAFVAAGDWR
jgi:CHAT domain-containing protein/tetratricopeptide (TPR) repeat protein